MLLIRQEYFGGIVFNTANGHKVYLDQDGVRGFIGYLHDNHRDKDCTAFCEAVCRNLDVRTNKVVYQIQNALPRLADDGLPVLSSPILVDVQITNYCNLACPHCYAGSSRAGKHGGVS